MMHDNSSVLSSRPDREDVMGFNTHGFINMSVTFLINIRTISFGCITSHLEDEPYLASLL